MVVGNYNNSMWKHGSESFEAFATPTPEVTNRTLSFPVEDLSTGKTVEMRELWC